MDPPRNWTGGGVVDLPRNRTGSGPVNCPGTGQQATVTDWVATSEPQKASTRWAAQNKRQCRPLGPLYWQGWPTGQSGQGKRDLEPGLEQIPELEQGLEPKLEPGRGFQAGVSS